MTEGPRLIAVYAVTTGAPERVAEFRWAPETGVSVTVFEPKWGDVARYYYDNGVPDRDRMRAVTPEEGPAFMSALAGLRPASYCRFVVED